MNVYSITLEDVETILGRKMTSDEIELFVHKFEIYDWVGWVEDTLQVLDIK